MQRIIRIFLSLTLIPLLGLASTSNALAQTTGGQVRITQVDKSRFPQVTVYVSVVNENGEPVGIDPATIQILENEQAMQPTEIRGGGTTQTIPLTTMLLIDISGSMDTRVPGLKSNRASSRAPNLSSTNSWPRVSPLLPLEVRP